MITIFELEYCVCVCVCVWERRLEQWNGVWMVNNPEVASYVYK